jgi:Zn-dependent protease
MNWQNILYSLPGIIIGLTVHEYCHAFAAYKLGDHTASESGRLTFNPLRHIDLIGFIFIIIAGFGWAKPVQFNPENLAHPRRDKAIIAASGPLSNMALALVFIAMIKAWLVLPEFISSEAVYTFFFTGSFVVVVDIIFRAATINLGLMIFNLLPIPPLDGSHIVFSGLNIKRETETAIMKIGAPLLLIILLIQNQTSITIIPIGNLIYAILRLLIPQLGL